MAVRMSIHMAMHMSSRYTVTLVVCCHCPLSARPAYPHCQPHCTVTVSSTRTSLCTSAHRRAHSFIPSDPAAGAVRRHVHARQLVDMYTHMSIRMSSRCTVCSVASERVYTHVPTPSSEQGPYTSLGRIATPRATASRPV